MTDNEKISKVKILCGNDTLADTLVSAYLDTAKSKIKNRLFSVVGVPEEWEIPSRYDEEHCELASRLILRRGAEGEISHDVDGVNRTYGSVDDSDILNKIIPYARVHKE